jgi:hypothetical protein
LVEQFLFARAVVYRLHRRADSDELVLCRRPLTLVDQLLDLAELGLRGEYHLVVPGGLLLPEQHGVQSVERVAGSRAVHHRAKTAEAQQRRGERAHHRHRRAGAAARRDGAIQGGNGVSLRHQTGRGWLAQLVAPAGEQVRERGVARISRVRRLLGRQGVEESVGAGDGVQRRITAVGAPATEIRHGRIPSP